jgi:hypothetical protein
MALLKRVLLIVSTIAILAGEGSARAGNPVGDFFKRLGNSIAHPRTSPAPRRTTSNGATTVKNKNGKEPTTPPDRPPAAPPIPPVPTPTPALTPMPVPLMVRSASGVPPSKKPRQDLPYGIPVPGKQGFVTSPYAPKSGYVDVRGFPSGTEVKDPYTGKVFLTP